MDLRTTDIPNASTTDKDLSWRVIIKADFTNAWRNWFSHVAKHLRRLRVGSVLMLLGYLYIVVLSVLTPYVIVAVLVGLLVFSFYYSGTAWCWHENDAWDLHSLRTRSDQYLRQLIRIRTTFLIVVTFIGELLALGYFLLVSIVSFGTWSFLTPEAMNLFFLSCLTYSIHHGVSSTWIAVKTGNFRHHALPPYERLPLRKPPSSISRFDFNRRKAFNKLKESQQALYSGGVFLFLLWNMLWLPLFALFGPLVMAYPNPTIVRQMTGTSYRPPESYGPFVPELTATWVLAWNVVLWILVVVMWWHAPRVLRRRLNDPREFELPPKLRQVLELVAIHQGVDLSTIQAASEANESPSSLPKMTPADVPSEQK